MITLIKLNESYSQVEVDDNGLRYELSDYFTFEVEGARWSPAFKEGFWDGKIRLLKNNMQIYTGLKDEIAKFCKQRKYEFNTVGFAEDNKIEPQKLKDIISSWNPTRFNTKLERVPLTPHKEQLTAIYAALTKKRIIIESATAAGKSFIVAALTKILAKNKTLIIVPRVDLANQMLENYHEYFEDWNPEIDLLYSGQKITGANILIATWQSLAKKSPAFFKDFKTVIYDEVHEAESKSACKILEACVNSEYRLGLTGTLKDAKTHLLTLQGLFGRNIKFSRAIDNINKGVSSQLDILVNKITYKEPLEGKFEGGTEKYRAELEYVWHNQKRNNLIFESVAKQDGTSLVLFKNIEHGEKLFVEYRKHYGKDDVFIIHGGIKQKKQIRQYITENPNKKIVLFASIGTFSTGINIKSIKYAILAGPIRDKIKLLQSIGRGLRKMDDNSKFTFVDIVDIIPKGNILKKHGIERVNRYIEEEFEYKVKKYSF